MSKIIVFALGNLWRWNNNSNRAKLINKIMELDVDGIEITLGKFEETQSFKLTKKQIEWLNSLKYVSMHAPFRLVRDAKNKQDMIKQMNKIQEIYNLTNSKNVIMHPGDIPDKEILENYNMNLSTENMVKKKNVSHKDLRNIMQNYNMKLCVDVAHSYFYSIDETKNLIDEFNKDISQFHLSGNYRRKDHLQLNMCSKNFLKSIEPLKKTKKPIIIEEDFRDINNINKVKEEIKFIKKFLN